MDHPDPSTQPTGGPALAPDLQDPNWLETLVPVCRTEAERITITESCRDADGLPKVDDAGLVHERPDGTRVQVMFNGVRVVAAGYYGSWLEELIRRCRGHHEPQEEVMFAEVLRHLPPGATMVELGGYWSFYSIWFLRDGPSRRSWIVEPDPAHLAVGQANARLNGCTPVFIPGYVGKHPRPPAPFQTELSGMVALPCIAVPQLLSDHGIERLDLLHCDAQGVELGVLESCVYLGAQGRLVWLVVSTHSHHISGDPLTHQRCLVVLRRAGATILAEHDVQESFSGDGLIVAVFGPVPTDWRTPRMSYNRASTSLFRHPLHDLAQARLEAASAPGPGPLAPVLSGGRFAATGGVLTLSEDGPLGPAGSTLLLPFDEVIYPAVAAEGGWSLDMLDFLDRHLVPERRWVLLDVGANVGLFSRQVALRFPPVDLLLCVEADPGNFRALHYNLGVLTPGRARLWNVALTDRDGVQQFFRDQDNFGNFSLNPDAMRDRPYAATMVQARETGAWMAAEVPDADGAALLWKSDTQGHDELIISRVPWAVWDRVAVALVELWRIDKPAFDRAAFRARIDAFANKTMNGGVLCTTAQVMAYLDSTDMLHTDLLMWR